MTVFAPNSDALLCSSVRYDSNVRSSGSVTGGQPTSVFVGGGQTTHGVAHTLTNNKKRLLCGVNVRVPVISILGMFMPV